MSTPKNQQQQHPTPLSTAKKGPVKGLKNILAQPHEILWPILKDEKERNELHSLLTEMLPIKKCRANAMNWSKLRKLSKDERSALKKDLCVKSSCDNEENFMCGLILGINGVTKALERNSICSILLDTNVDPLFMIKHIVIMGENKNIPVLMIPFLKTVTLNKIGFSCAALGIKRSIGEMENQHFYKLYKKISHLVNVFIEKKASVQLFNANDNEIDSQSNAKYNCLVDNIPIDNTINNQMQNFTILPSVYKYRSSCNERAFIPPGSQPIIIDKMESSMDFIALANDNDNDNCHQLNKMNNMFKQCGRYMNINSSNEKLLSTINDKSIDIKIETGKNIKLKSNINENHRNNNKLKSYIPLKVKRIQGNPKRLKATKLKKKMVNAKQ